MINLLWIIPVGLVAHELGHVIVCLCYGIKPKRIVVCWRGVGVEFKADIKDLDKETQAWAALGGPLASATLAVATWNACPMLSRLSLWLALFNMLPLKGSDGRRIANLWRDQ